MILTSEKLKEVESRIKQHLAQGLIQTKQKNHNSEFFLLNAKRSLNSAEALFKLSTNKEMQKATGFFDFDGYLWVVNASYYSMFYMARALLEKEGVKLSSDLSIHLLTFDALINFFYLNGKLEKKLIEDFAQAKEEASEILGKQKADELIEDYFYEKNKRATLTYNTEELVIKNKAKTSLQRARRFIIELQEMM